MYKTMGMLALFLVLVGCGGTNQELLQEELYKNQALWASKHVNQYQFTFDRRCFCIPEEKIVVTVDNENITSAIYTPSNERVADSRIDSLLTVADLFGVIQKAIDDKVFSLVIKYDSEYGYPVEVAIDHDKQAVDEEVTYKVGDFKPNKMSNQQALDTYRALWSTKNFSDYEFTFETSCFCLPEENIVVSVESNEIATATYTPSEVPVSEARINSLKTINELFSLIQNSIDDNVYSLIVEYDSINGYPMVISIDQDKNIVDEEITYKLSAFKYDTNHQQNLDSHRVLWNSNQINDYEFTFDTLCFCFPEESVVVTVEAGDIITAMYTPSDVPVPDSRVNRLKTVDDLFLVIQKSIDENVYSLVVEYDSTYGYPVSVSIDQDKHIADEEIIYKLTDFQRSLGNQENLNLQRALWASKQVTDYQYSYHRLCGECIYEEKIAINVLNEEVETAIYTPSNEPVSDQRLETVPVIEDLFEIVQDAIDQNAYSLQVTYDSTFGYPLNISIDYEQLMVDDEVDYVISDFLSATLYINAINQEYCSEIKMCGDLGKLDCNSAADGPLYYFSLESEQVLSVCGGACMIPDAAQQQICQTMCPPPSWDCEN